MLLTTSSQKIRLPWHTGLLKALLVGLANLLLSTTAYALFTETTEASSLAVGIIAVWVIVPLCFLIIYRYRKSRQPSQPQNGHNRLAWHTGLVWMLLIWIVNSYVVFILCLLLISRLSEGNILFIIPIVGVSLSVWISVPVLFLFWYRRQLRITFLKNSGPPDPSKETNGNVADSDFLPSVIASLPEKYPKHKVPNSKAKTIEELKPITVFESLNGSMKRALRAQAITDFKNTRGYAHRSLLHNTNDRLQSELRKSTHEMKQLEVSLKQADTDEINELKQSLQQYWMSTKLTEIPGIGQILAFRILHELKPQQLLDLRKAETIHGVSEVRLYEINQWILKYQQLLPQYLQIPFPDKMTIQDKFQAQRMQWQQRILILKQQIDRIEQQSVRVQEELAWLDAVNEQDFVDARQGKGDEAKIQRFTIGVFAAWESVPDWFREIVTLEIRS